MKRHRYLEGMNAQLRRSARGTIVSARPSRSGWRHPWSLDLQWRADSQAPAGLWRGHVWPGFVNGRDAFVGVPPSETFPDGLSALTDDPAPTLNFGGWRDPAASAGVAVTGDSLRLLPGEGYPKFFETLGVVPVAKGGDPFAASSGVPYDEARTRQIRAMDVVLTIPRIGTRLEYNVLNPFTSQRTEQIDTVYVTDYYRAVKGRSVLRAVTKFSPPVETSLAATYGQLLSGGSSEYDEIHLATAYVVSPRDVGEGAEPDETWTPWVRQMTAGFWNLNSATNVIPASKPDLAIRFLLPLAGGLAQPVVDRLLATVNDAAEEAAAFLFANQAKGYVWNV